MQWPAPDLLTQRDGAAMLRLIWQSADIEEGEEMVTALDGPQGLSEPGQIMRACERLLGTNGHTPPDLPPPMEGSPVHMGGYLRSSLDLFGALADLEDLYLAGLDPNITLAANLFEIFPGAEWTVLAARRLLRKSTVEGRQERRDVLEAAGLIFPDDLGLPTPDQNDAAVGAYLLKCSRDDPARVRLVGAAPRFDGVQLREGLILHANAAVERPVREIVGTPLPTEPGSAGDPVPIVTPCELGSGDEWNAEDDRGRVFFTDNALVWGTRPENRWLSAGRNYVCTGSGPTGAVQFTLTFAPTVSAPAWTVEPHIKLLLRQLGFAPPRHLRSATGISVFVEAAMV